MKKIVVFGAGIRGKCYISNPYIKSDIVAIVDNNKNLWGTYYEGIPVLSPDEIRNLEYDYVIIAINDEKIVSDVKQQLLELCVPKDKILLFSECPRVIIWGCGDIERSLLMFVSSGNDVKFVHNNNELFDKNYMGVPVISLEELTKLKYYGSIVITSQSNYIDIKKQLSDIGISADRINYYGCLVQTHVNSARFLYMKNFAKWINEQNLEGSVAECGVNTGDSAKFINEYFPNRKLYLFDTFEGFAEQDIKAEQKLNNDEFLNSQFNKVGLFSGTKEDIVMKKMTYPENVIIKKGYFPDSAKDINDKFCFVNLDMDLYQPMLAALHFFWDKVIEGGCIVLHDYFHPKLPGVAQAVTDFEKQRNIKLSKTVVGDNCSIAILK